VHRETYGLKTCPTDKIIRKTVFDNKKTPFLVVCVGKPTDFTSPPMATQAVRLTAPIGTHAETPIEEIKVEAADLS
jgi:hypothetical protein